MMRILVLGAGATGGYFGGRLVEAGADVTFLVRPARADQLAADGLRIVSPEGDFAAHVATITSAPSAYDLVILSCKAYDLEPSIEAIEPAVGRETLILPLLNGLVHLERLDASFAPEQVLGGVCHIGATLARSGEIRHLNRIHRIAFGERRGTATARTEAIAALFAQARFTSRLSSDILQNLWDKFVFLTTLAGMTCLMRASVGAILSTRDGESLTTELFEECRAVAAASGRPLSPEMARTTLGQLTERGSSFTSSMLRDIEAGNRTEADHIVGDMLRRSHELGIQAPLLRVAHCHLQSYEAQRLAGAPSKAGETR